jgi:RHS repeat-associated protein
MRPFHWCLTLALIGVPTLAAQQESGIRNTGRFVEGPALRISSNHPDAACPPPPPSSIGIYFPSFLNRESFAYGVHWVMNDASGNCVYSGVGSYSLKTPPQHGSVRLAVENQVITGSTSSVAVLDIYYTWTDSNTLAGQDAFTVHLVSPTGSPQVDLVISTTLDGTQPFKCDGPPTESDPYVVDPITLATGNVFEAVTDYATAGPNSLGFTRFYNSGANPTTFATSMGSRWRSTYDRYLRTVSASSVQVERAEGQVLSFTLSGGAWGSDTDVDLKLTQSGSNWTLTDTDDNVETYSTVSTGEARLTSIQSRNGYAKNLQYNAANQLLSVTDSYNRALNFAYQGGLLHTVTTPDSLVLTYSYNSSGVTPGVLDRLASVGFSTSPSTSQSYVYENPNLPLALTGIVDENGNRFVTWTYDAFGRGLTSQLGSGAFLATIVYNDNDNSRNVTNALGEQEIYKFSLLQGVPKVTEIDRVAAASLPAATQKFTYDANGYIASWTDWNGNLTTYVNDVHGQHTTINEAVGTPQARTKTVTYHPTFHLPVTIVEPGITTNLTYDTAGELLTRTAVDTTTNTAPYPTNGTSRTWTLTWLNFLATSVQGPRTDVKPLTQFTYDNSGALTAVTNALGQITKVTAHSPGGLPQTIVDRNGVTTQLAYDARLRLTSSTLTTSAGPLITKYSYDAAGNLIGVTLPDGSALSNTYDGAHRLTGIADLFNQKIVYTLDALGGRTQTTILDSNGKQQLQRFASFDALGRLLKDIGGVGQTTSYAYDANGNVLSVTDPLTRATQEAFDALNRIVKITNPNNGIAVTTYDAHDRPTGVTDPIGATTSYVYDGFGDLIQQVSPAAGTTVYHYDLAGNLTQRVDARGVTANYAYDALDRPVATTYPDNAAENVTLNYDQAGHGFGVGRLTSVTDPVGTLSRTYDERGNVLSETRVHTPGSLITSYSYDAANRVTSITYPSGSIVTYSRDAMGRTTAVSAKPKGSSTATQVLSKITYQPFGPVNAQIFGNGVAETRSFDADYRLTKLVGTGNKPVQNLTYGYDAANNVLSITDGVTSANSQTFGYDVLNRLTNATGGYASLGYSYDANGNRLTENPAAPISLDGLGSVSSLTYNQSGRLASVSAGSQLLTQYTYNAFGQRLVKVGSMTATTLFSYDGGGHLLEESDGQGNPQVDYIYVGGRPLAEMAPGGKVYFFHDDRLGTPQVATDNTQSTAWLANYQPFGATNSSSNLIAQDLRLPGQEVDIETGLYHNGFRNYTPGLGSYSQGDPIGLAGGINRYAYARNNPVFATDLHGLSIQTDRDACVADCVRDIVNERGKGPQVTEQDIEVEINQSLFMEAKSSIDFNLTGVDPQEVISVLERHGLEAEQIPLADISSQLDSGHLVLATRNNPTVVPLCTTRHEIIIRQHILINGDLYYAASSPGEGDDYIIVSPSQLSSLFSPIAVK